MNDNELSVGRQAEIETRMEELNRVFSKPRRRTPEQIIDGVLQQRYPETKFALKAIEAFEDEGYTIAEATPFIVEARKNMRQK